MKLVNFRITEELHQRIRNYMLRERRGSQSEVIRLLLEDALNLADGPTKYTAASQWTTPQTEEAE